MKRKASSEQVGPSGNKKVKLDNEKKLYVVLEEAYLETVLVKDRYELLNCDDHRNILKKHKKDYADARPDITHQVFQILKCQTFLTFSVSLEPFRQPVEQSWTSSSLHSHSKKSFD